MQSTKPLVNIPDIVWQTKEYEKTQKSLAWYAIATFILVSIVAYSLWTESPLMAITFILIGATGYLILERDPKEMRFALTAEGVEADREIYKYSSLRSFSIQEHKHALPTLSLRTTTDIMPFVRVPLGSQDPESIRDYLSHFLKEEEHPVRFVDILENVF